MASRSLLCIGSSERLPFSLIARRTSSCPAIRSLLKSPRCGGLYLNPPDHAIVLSVDEKSQIQALDRTQPVLPMDWVMWKE